MNALDPVQLELFGERVHTFRIAPLRECPPVEQTPIEPRLELTDWRRSFMRRFIWCGIKELGHATATELAAHCQRKVTTIRPRLTELAALRHIRDIGQRRAPGAKRGPMERVWEIMPFE